jgi:hypothetical protein
VGHAIRKSASILPGYGPSDVYYPLAFQGLWNMKREIIRNGNGDSRPNLMFHYKVRFLPSDNGNAVVADRGYNQAHLEAAIRGSSASRGGDNKGIGIDIDNDIDNDTDISAAVRSYDWSVTNPNELQVALQDGSSKYIKVTKRATEATDTTVYSSEFQRVSQPDVATGIPVVTARRVMTKWKVRTTATAADAATNTNNNNNSSSSKDSDSISISANDASASASTISIEGLEIVYDMGGGGDPLSATTATALASQAAEPKVLSKSRLLLER